MCRAAQVSPEFLKSPNAFPLSRGLLEYHNPDDPATITALGKLALAGQSSAAYALRTIHTRDAMPSLIALLDSGEPNVRADALSGICLFARNSPTLTPESVPMMSWMQSREPAPFRNGETDRYCWMGGTLDPLRESPYISFWKDWWASHSDTVLR